MAPPVALGKTHTFTPLQPSTDDLSSDVLYQSILQAAQGGQATADYFTTITTIGQLYTRLATQGNDAWEKDYDEQGNDVYAVSMDAQGGTYYITLATENLTVNENGDLGTTGEEIVINGTTYRVAGVATYTVGWGDFVFAKVSRVVGILAGGTAAASYFLPLIMNALKKLGKAIANAFGRVSTSGDTGGEELQEEVEEADAAGEEEIAEGGEIAVEEGVVATGASIALGTVFIGACVVIAVAFIALSFILHNSFHYVRIWNLTKYDMAWTYVFDTETFGIGEGQITSGPLDSKTSTPAVIGGASRRTGIKHVYSREPKVHYADLHVASSHEFSGIGYALQLYLKDQITKELKYTITIYYDIPFSGANSTDVTFDPIPASDLYNWYKDNQGNNQTLCSQKTSSDGVITATTTYDYLTGAHPAPSPTEPGSNSNELYYYQSILCIAENNLKASDLPS